MTFLPAAAQQAASAISIDSKPAAAAISQAVAHDWAWGPVKGSHLPRRAFNDVCALQFEDGSQRKQVDLLSSWESLQTPA